MARSAVAESAEKTYKLEFNGLKFVLTVNAMELLVIFTLLFLLGAAIFLATYAHRRAKVAARANKELNAEILERRRAADALRESQERYRALTESIPHLVWTSKPDGACDYLSRQWLDYSGRSAEEQLAAGWADLLHPDDRPGVERAWRQAVELTDPFETQFRMRRGDGVYRWFRSRAVPLRDEAGRVIKWFGSNSDFEDYHVAQQKLQAQLSCLNLLDQITHAIGERLDLRSIFQVVLNTLEEDLPIDFGCICLYDAATDVLTVNSVGGRSGGLAEQLCLTDNAQISVVENGLGGCVQGHLLHEREAGSSAFPFAARLALCGLRSLVAAPLLSESSTFGMLLAARRQPQSFSSSDCEFLRQLSAHVSLAGRQAQIYSALQQAYDDLRRTQESVMEHERLRTLGQMASGIAHDINNALSPVALYTEALLEREPGLSTRTREYLETTQRAIGDVAQTVGRMREFYRQREFQLTLIPVDINRLIQQVLDLTRARWSDMPQRMGIMIDMQTDLAPDLPPIAAVESDIREALTNLIFNAVDAMPAGGILILRTFAGKETAPSPLARVHVEIKDTGVGMDEETQRRCLEPFFSTKGERGTGLGLAMVYGAVQRQNADIKIESAPGDGTTVRLTFPLATFKAADAVESPYRHVPPVCLRVLAVDDDPLILKSLRATLEADGHIVTTASGGREGIDILQATAERNEQFAVVITDLGMPYIDGRKVASAAKIACRTTPVILLTGWGQRVTAEEQVPANVDRVLNKPPKLQQLRTALAELVPGRDPASS